MTSQTGEMSSEEFIQALLSRTRDERLDMFLILNLSGINLHDTVAEIGCGPGYFTLPLAKYLVSGSLYALDIDDDMLKACESRVSQAQMGNVEILKCGEFDFPLENESVDGAFLAFVIQQSPDKQRFLNAVREIIHPKGWCSILEWYKIETETGPPLERRIDPQDMQKIAEDVGFRNVTTRSLNPEQYLMTMRNR